MPEVTLLISASHRRVSRICLTSDFPKYLSGSIGARTKIHRASCSPVERRRSSELPKCPRFRLFRRAERAPSRALFSIKARRRWKKETNEGHYSAIDLTMSPSFVRSIEPRTGNTANLFVNDASHAFRRSQRFSSSSISTQPRRSS